MVRALYHVYFHPLSKFAGPKYLALSRIPVTLATLRGRRAQFRFDLHRKYGEIVRVAPDELSFAHSRAWKEIYGTASTLLPTETIHGVDSEDGARTVVTANGEDHTRQKRMITTILSEKMLKEKEPMFVKYADLLVQRLQESKEAPVDISDWYNFTTFDLVGDLFFGESMGLLADSKYIPWVKAIQDFLKAFAMIVVLHEYRIFRILWSLMPARLMKHLRDTHLSYTTDKLERYMKRPERDTEGIMARLMDGGSHQGLQLKELHANAPIFVFAGSESSSSLLRSVTYLLLKNPVCMEKLVTEIRQSFATSEDITYDAIPTLPYLNGCFEEGLRVYSPCTNGLPRRVPPEGATVCGEWVPGGTNVSVAAYSLHRSPSYFHMSDSFVPERWLDDRKERDPQFDKDNKNVFQPWSYGAHNCPGKK